MAAPLTYTDRFGYRWTVRRSRAPQGGWFVEFVSRDLKLVTPEPVDANPRTLTTAQLKELFCDAERQFASGGETWYVGYRQTTSGGRGNSHGGLSTRFRSASGEVRYSREMLDFRHMPTANLCRHVQGTDKPVARGKKAG